MNDINKAVSMAKKPGSIFCFVCNDSLYSPMDKLCILLYDKCPTHLQAGGAEEKNLLKIADLL